MLKKRVLCSALALATAIATATGAVNGLTASGETEQETTKKVEIVDEFLISSWISYYSLDIKTYEQQTKELSEAGLNFMWHPTNISGTAFSSDVGLTRKQLDDLYKANNMTYLVDATKNISMDEMQGLDNCVGYYIKDEPSASQFQATKDSYMQYYAMDPARRPFVNLYPNYAGSTALGGTYSDYVNNWVDTIGAENME